MRVFCQLIFWFIFGSLHSAMQDTDEHFDAPKRCFDGPSVLYPDVEYNEIINFLRRACKHANTHRDSALRFLESTFNVCMSEDHFWCEHARFFMQARVFAEAYKMLAEAGVSLKGRANVYSNFQALLGLISEGTYRKKKITKDDMCSAFEWNKESAGDLEGMLDLSYHSLLKATNDVADHLVYLGAPIPGMDEFLVVLEKRNPLSIIGRMFYVKSNDSCTVFKFSNESLRDAHAFVFELQSRGFRCIKEAVNAAPQTSVCTSEFMQKRAHFLKNGIASTKLKYLGPFIVEFIDTVLCGDRVTSLLRPQSTLLDKAISFWHLSQSLKWQNNALFCIEKALSGRWGLKFLGAEGAVLVSFVFWHIRTNVEVSERKDHLSAARYFSCNWAHRGPGYKSYDYLQVLLYAILPVNLYKACRIALEKASALYECTSGIIETKEYEQRVDKIWSDDVSLEDCMREQIALNEAMRSIRMHMRYEKNAIFEVSGLRTDFATDILARLSNDDWKCPFLESVQSVAS